MPAMRSTTPEGKILTIDDMDNSYYYIDQYTSKIDYYCPTPIKPEGSIFVGWYQSMNYSGKTITHIYEGTKEKLTLYARFISGVNLSIAPTSWVLNCDSSAAGGKLVVSVKGG